MPVPSSLVDVSTTASSNSPAGSEARSTSDDYHRNTQAMLKGAVAQGADVASASTLAIPAAGLNFDITGTTGITAISSTNSWDGREITLQFDGACLLTHSASFDLSGANITTAAGTQLKFVQRSSGSWKIARDFIQSGTGATTRTALAKLRDIVSVKDFAATGDGSTDDTAAVQATITAVGAAGGGTVFFPSGFYKITSTLLISSPYIYLRGAGKRSTQFVFSPAGADTCIEVHNGGSIIFGGGISDLTFNSANNTDTKIAIELIDTSDYTISDIEILGNSNVWTGAGSIGIKVQGREIGRISNIYIAADRPILIADNPNSTLDIDHFNFHNCYLIASGNPVIEIATGVNLTDVSFSGQQAWVLGTDGLKWVDTTSSIVSFALSLQNVRWEQGTSATANIINIAHNTNLQGLNIVNCRDGGERNGYKLRKVKNAIFDGCYFVGGSGRTAMDVDSTVIGMQFVNCYWEAASTATMTGQQLLYRTPLNPNIGPLPPTAFYDSTTNTKRGMVFGDAVSQESFSLANNAIQILSADENMWGFLTVASNQGVIGTFQMGGSAHTVAEISDPSAVFSTTAGTVSSTNVYWSAGNTRYEIENKRGGTVAYKILLTGSYAAF